MDRESQFQNLSPQLAIHRSALNPRSEILFSREVIESLTLIHHQLEPERQKLLQARRERQARYDSGELPSFVENHPAQDSSWKVAAIPPELQERRVEITGPANSSKMVINMLNPGPDGIPADMAMLDLEDSMKPSWENVIEAIYNVRGVANEDLEFVTPKKTYSLHPGKRAYPMVRVRGLHLFEANLQVDGREISASIFDTLMVAAHSARIFLGKKLTPKFYVPKCEHYLEARWWHQLFSAVEKALALPNNCLRVTFLIETLPAAFQVEEILYEIRERACGVNGGRWDKIFSDIKVLKNHGDRIAPDRSSIDMSRPWMDNYAKRLIKICHRHGAFAMGGMSAFTPGKDEATRKLQTEKVRQDKAREAQIGHDGCWVSHPYFIAIARAQFKEKNQLHRLLEDFDEHADLLPQATGPTTEKGLRTNVRVGIAYYKGWNEDLGCVAFDNLMEDLATLEISRAQTWQWLHHQVKLDNGQKVTPGLVARIFDEECDRIISELEGQAQTEVEAYRKAKLDAEKLFLQEDLPDFFTQSSETPRSPK